MADHGHSSHGHHAAEHAADHAHEHHHGHGSFEKATQRWVNPLTDPYRGWRFDKFNQRRMRFFGAAWIYGVVFGGWMSYRLLNEWSAWTWPYTHSFHTGKYASQAAHDNPYSEGHGHGHGEH